MVWVWDLIILSTALAFPHLVSIVVELSWLPFVFQLLFNFFQFLFFSLSSGHAFVLFVSYLFSMTHLIRAFLLPKFCFLSSFVFHPFYHLLAVRSCCLLPSPSLWLSIAPGRLCAEAPFSCSERRRRRQQPGNTGAHTAASAAQEFHRSFNLDNHTQAHPPFQRKDGRRVKRNRSTSLGAHQCQRDAEIATV